MNNLPKPSKQKFTFNKVKINHSILRNNINLYNVIKPSSDLVTLVFILPIAEQSSSTYPSGSISLSLKILFEQVNDKSNMSLQQKLENSGSDPIYSSDSEKIIIGFQSTSNNWENSLNIMLDAIKNIDINSDEFMRIKKLRSGEILQNEGNPMFLARSGLLSNIYNSNSIKSYSSIGRLSEINQIKLESIKNIAKKIFDINTETKIALISNNKYPKLIKILDSINPCLDTKEYKYNNDQGLNKNLLIATKIPSPQSVILFAKRLSIPNFNERISLEIFNEIFGGSFMSRLNNNLRERNGYSYGFGSSISWASNSEPTIFAGGSVNSNNTTDSIDEINHEINSIFSNNKLKDSEINNAIFSIKLGFLKNFETQMSSISLTNKIILENLSLDFHDSYFDKIESITKNDIYDYINLNFSNLKDFSTVVVGDKTHLDKLINEEKLYADIINAENII
tara:strand:+ start:1239 stop:2594 length:1356 start_codon:yes stop_codon:yes gene_type:complete